MQSLDWIALALFLIAWIGIEPMMAIGWPRRTNSANLIVIVGMSSALFMEPNLGVDSGIIAKFTAAGPIWLFQCKVVLVMATLLRGLSDFIWAVRQINYCLAAIGASPSREEQRDIEA